MAEPEPNPQSAPTKDEVIDLAVRDGYVNLRTGMLQYGIPESSPLIETLLMALGMSVNQLRERNGELIQGAILTEGQSQAPAHAEVVQLTGHLRHVSQNYGALMHCMGVAVHPVDNRNDLFEFRFTDGSVRRFVRGGGDHVEEVGLEDNQPIRKEVTTDDMRKGSEEWNRKLHANELKPLDLED